MISFIRKTEITEGSTLTYHRPIWRWWSWFQDWPADGSETGMRQWRIGNRSARPRSRSFSSSARPSCRSCSSRDCGPSSNSSSSLVWCLVYASLAIYRSLKKIGNWHVKKHVLGRDSEFTMRPRPRNRSNDRNSRGEISLRFEIRLESNREILFRDWETICTSTRWSRIYECFFRIANYNLRCFSIGECWSVVYRNFMKFSR